LTRPRRPAGAPGSGAGAVLARPSPSYLSSGRERNRFSSIYPSSRRSAWGFRVNSCGRVHPRKAR